MTEDRGRTRDDGRRTTEDGRQTTGGSLPQGRDGRRDIRHTTYDIRDTIIVQGIIDLLIETAEGLIVVDFKTDRVSQSQAAERAELYRAQLETYAKAAASILKTESVAKYLYFLTPQLTVML